MPSAKSTPYVGRALKRVEDPRLIKGIATYVDDLALPGMLHAAILRSPYAHARINSVRTEAARAALDLIEVDYEPLPVVSDPEKALEKSSPLTHPEFGTNVAFNWSVANGDLDTAF